MVYLTTLKEIIEEMNNPTYSAQCFYCTICILHSQSIIKSEIYVEEREQEAKNRLGETTKKPFQEKIILILKRNSPNTGKPRASDI